MSDYYEHDISNYQIQINDQDAKQKYAYFLL